MCIWAGLGLIKKTEKVTFKQMSITYQPKKRKRARAHGFLKRSKSPGGLKVLQNRRRKGRKKIAV